MIQYKITNAKWSNELDGNPSKHKECWVGDCDMIGCLTTVPKKSKAKKFYAEDEKQVEAIIKKFNYEYIKSGKSEKKPKKVQRKKGD